MKLVLIITGSLMKLVLIIAGSLMKLVLIIGWVSEEASADHYWISDEASADHCWILDERLVLIIAGSLKKLVLIITGCPMTLVLIIYNSAMCWNTASTYLPVQDRSDRLLCKRLQAQQWPPEIPSCWRRTHKVLSRSSICVVGRVCAATRRRQGSWNAY